MSAANLHQGDRVRIVADDHPWNGETGTLAKNTEASKFPWRVSLDRNPFTKAAVYEDEVERVQP